MSDIFVVFVDMLGFADLVESDPNGVDELNPIFKSADGLDVPELDMSEPPPSELGERFTHFHRCLNSAKQRVQTARSGTVVVFSDSAFFQLNSLTAATDIARELMRNLIFRRVPTRIGIGRGSFRVLRFMSDTSTQVDFHISQFLGTGIVRAHAAEQCGAKGLRILLHPDLSPCVENNDIKRVILVEPPPTRLPVSSELNYLYESSHPQNMFSGGKDLDQLILSLIQEMMRESPEAVRDHYIDTFHALNRMRTQLDRPSYSLDAFLAS